MRFSAITVSAAVFGVALAMPANVVYTTEIVTITSCAASVTNCPGRTHTSVAIIPTSVASVSSVASASSIASVSSVASASSIASVSSVATASSVVSVSSVATASSVVVSVSTGIYTSNSTHPHTTSPPVIATTSSYAWTPSASAGIPPAPGNSSTPVIPITPPAFPGAASTNGFSFAAVAIAAAVFVFV